MPVDHHYTQERVTMKTNEDFGGVLKPLIAPIYVLQMAKGRKWSKEARRRHLLTFARAAEEAAGYARYLVEKDERVGV